jgi:hypothetical protein
MPMEQTSAATAKLALLHVAAGIGMAATATQCTMLNEKARPKTSPTLSNAYWIDSFPGGV